MNRVSLDGFTFDDRYYLHQMTVTDDGVLVTAGWCKPHQSRISRTNTEDSRSGNNDSVDHNDDGTEDMSGQSDSEEEEEVECLVYYKLNY